MSTAFSLLIFQRSSVRSAELLLVAVVGVEVIKRPTQMFNHATATPPLLLDLRAVSLGFAPELHLLVQKLGP